MPIIPRFDGDQAGRRQVLPVVALPQQVQPGAAAGVGAGLQDASGVFAKEGEEEKKRADNSAAMKALSSVRRKRTELLYAQPDETGTKGLTYLTGDAFLAAKDTAVDDYGTYVSSQRDLLTSPEQRVLFDQGVNGETDALHEVLERREGSLTLDQDEAELSDYLTEGIEAGAKDAANGRMGLIPKGSLAPGEPQQFELEDDKVTAHLQTLDNQLLAYATDHEKTLALPLPIWVAGMRRRLHSDFHKAVVREGLSQGQLGLAGKYFEKHKDEMLSKDRTVLQSSLQSGNDAQHVVSVADEAADNAWAEGLGDPAYRAANPDKALPTTPQRREAGLKRLRAAAKGGPDERLLPEIEQRYGQVFDQKAQALEGHKRELYRTFDTRLTQGEDIPDIQQDPNWSELDGDQQRALVLLRNRLQAGDWTQTDDQLFYDLKTLAADPATAHDFADMDLYVQRPHLSADDWRELVSLQAATIGALGLAGQKADEQARKLLTGFRADWKVVDDALEVLMRSKPYASLSKDDKAKTAVGFRRAVDEEMTAEQVLSGKKMEGKEVEALVNRMSARHIYERSGTGPDWLYPDVEKATFELRPEDIRVEDIPLPLRQRFQGQLVQGGAVATDDDLKFMYLASLRAGTDQ